MSINVLCPGCKKRFAVSDKFAGQQGPCPNCKTVISIPAKSDEVVVHTPDDVTSPRDSEGKQVLAPILREEPRFSPKLAIAAFVGILGIFVIAAAVGRSSEGDVPLIWQGLTAVVLAPIIVRSGYAFLRDDELEPFRGVELILRVTACALVYAFLWGAYAWVQAVLEIDITATQLVFVAPVVLFVGTLAAFASLDLDFLSGMVHYGMYLIVTVLLRWVAGMAPF